MNEIHGHPYVFRHPLQRTIRCRSLLEWVPGESNLMSHSLLDLKGAGSTQSWVRWAGHFLETHAGGLFPQGAPYVFWPVPAADPSRQHARDFAVALAGNLGACLLDFEPAGNAAESVKARSPQKRRRRIERLQRLATNSSLAGVGTNPGLRGFAPAPLRAQTLVIVDDILTTGATTLWCARQLAGGQPVEVWTLAHRSRLAP